MGSEMCIRDSNTINPEYGRNGGAILNAETKSGSNQIHGAGFEFYRDTSLNTRNFFSPSATIFHQNQFGGVIGGPIKKNKAFFFFAYQGTRNRQPDLNGGNSTTVFSQQERSGNFSADTGGGFPAMNPNTGAPAVSPFSLVGENGQTYPAGTQNLYLLHLRARPVQAPAQPDPDSRGRLGDRHAAHCHQ